MRKLETALALGMLLGTVARLSTAEEGMWLPHQIRDLDLSAKGLKVNPQAIYREDGTGMMSAVVPFVGGGTGELVSSEGLILTNHHIAFDALQMESTKEKDFLADGFVARTREEEMPAKGFGISVLLGYREVTAEVLSAVRPGMSAREVNDAIDGRTKALIAEAERESKDTRASVVEMYSGNSYYLYRFKQISDIRIVYAPPLCLGRYGGEIDNWMWPRHTSDFAFMRAYVSPDGTGVGYSKDNVPFKPKAFLKVSLAGVREGDFAFVMGYPYRTFRNFTLAELRFDLGRIKRTNEVMSVAKSFLEEAVRKDPEIRLKYAASLKSLNNWTKNFQAKVEGIERHGVLGKKQSQEEEFAVWAAGSDERRQAYGQALARVDVFMKGYERYSIRARLLDELVNPYATTTLLGQAHTIYRTVLERQKRDVDRDPAFQDRNLAAIRSKVELAEHEYDLQTDRAFLAHRLVRLATLPAELRPAALKGVLEKGTNEAIAAYVDDVYARTVLADGKKRLELLDLDLASLEKLSDPLVRMAATLESDMSTLRQEGKAFEQERMDLRKVYLKALLEQKNGRLAPDANATLRFTYGLVEGYRPRDAVRYLPQTSLTGLIEKDKGEYPFLAPPKLRELHASKDFGGYLDTGLNDVPICFLTSTVISGGNSGSPTLNANGELTGVVFDMTYESVTGDYFEIPEVRRTISVDVRNALFLTEKLGGITHVTKELGF